jgi:predicted permease
MWNAEWSGVLPGYFETVGIEVLSGRTFTEADGADGEPVTLIGRETAELFFPGDDPLGQRIALPGSNAPWTRIVGVVEGTRTESLQGELWPQVYFPHAQAPVMYYGTPRSMGFTLRTELDPTSLAGSVRATVGELDPDLPLSGVRTMRQALGAAVAQPRLITNLLGAFALIALLLAALGIYGVVSYSVARRTREIGIRMALGAEGGQLAALMVKEGTWPALVGIAVGVPAALALSGLLSGLLYEVSPRDPVSFVALPLVLLGVALLSSYLPARRAARMAPTTALREE